MAVLEVCTPISSATGAMASAYKIPQIFVLMIRIPTVMKTIIASPHSLLCLSWPQKYFSLMRLLSSSTDYWSRGLTPKECVFFFFLFPFCSQALVLPPALAMSAGLKTRAMFVQSAASHTSPTRALVTVVWSKTARSPRFAGPLINVMCAPSAARATWRILPPAPGVLSLNVSYLLFLLVRADCLPPCLCFACFVHDWLQTVLQVSSIIIMYTSSRIDEPTMRA